MHTLKGNAGFIGKAVLHKAATEVEALLLNGTIPIPEEKMRHLKAEFELVIEELKPLCDNADLS